MMSLTQAVSATSPQNLCLKRAIGSTFPYLQITRKLGISGATVQSSLYLVDNHTRFLNSPTEGALSAVEIGFIPELAQNRLLHIASLETFQFIAGPEFNAFYSGSDTKLIYSSNPIELDEYALN